ncbi:hypothetical protein DaAHT2_1071 [Desulfurivibrio alkaliphilus AHT 2]|uniref:DUF948 domain-containing protein n=1 Tax=Desulfurivibrio alkaliphilus (strain DSM 19089 / UNIQEM U267 / AHT2) TaxID=589865 RepID=D6Z2J4_DESAT|nr:hypothetical protein DaAHT2_1071 [Desulfurivibrio alkaliphilus AHT 2]
MINCLHTAGLTAELSTNQPPGGKILTPLDIFLIFTAGSILILTAVLVPTLLQLKRTYKKAEETLQVLERELVPMSKKITAGAAEVELLAASCTAKLEETDEAIRAVRRAGDTLLLTSQALKDSVRPVISGVGGITAGLQMFARVLLGGKK